jgi:hypothetical protein
VDPIIDAFGVGHVFEHDVADLEGLLAKAELERFDDADLISVVALDSPL